ncbi:MAG TPA: hypothetical protein VFS96_04505, partial [Nitrolancea sp.]|nr:hypothetical protein [Nitrolancea sp.]
CPCTMPEETIRFRDVLLSRIRPSAMVWTGRGSSLPAFLCDDTGKRLPDRTVRPDGAATYTFPS